MVEYPPLEELLFARMPVSGEKRSYPRKWDESGKSFKDLCLLTEKLRTIWDERKTLSLSKRCVKSKEKTIQFMRRMFSVSKSYIEENHHVVHSSEMADNDWFKVIYGGILRQGESQFQDNTGINISQMSGLSEDYSLICASLINTGSEPPSGTKMLNLVAIVTEDERRGLINLLNKNTVVVLIGR